MKLLRKDVLKWIRALQSGSYKKGNGKLVSPDGTKFCCLGVWADMHGAVWEEFLEWDDNVLEMRPKPNDLCKMSKRQTNGILRDRRLTHGLSDDVQNKLTEINDKSRGFGKVVTYIKEKILPRAK